MVKLFPVSSKVLKAVIAYHQSALEKKSALTLKDPQNVQINGKQAIINQKIINVVLKNLNKKKYNGTIINIKDNIIGHRSDLSAYFDSAGATNSIIAALNHLAGKWIRVYDENGVLLN